MNFDEAQADRGGRDMVHYRKNYRIQEGMKRTMQEFVDKANAEEEADQRSLSEGMEAAAHRMRPSPKIDERKQHIAKIESRGDVFVEAAASFLAGIAYRALPLHGGALIDEHGPTIEENYRKFFVDSLRTGLISLESVKAGKSDCGLSIWRACEAAADTALETDGDFGYAAVLVEASAGGEAAAAVKQSKENVVHTIRTEKKIAEKEQADLRDAEGKPDDEAKLGEAVRLARRPEPESLFRSMVASAVRAGGQEPDMEMAFAEAVCAYTLLETVNVLGLIPLTPVSARELARSFSGGTSSKQVLSETVGPALFGAVAPHSTEFEPDSKHWDAGAQFTLSDVNKLAESCAWGDPRQPDKKSSYKLLHHSAKTGLANWTGVQTAMRLLVSESKVGVQIPDADKAAAYEHLAQHYRDHGSEPPAFPANKKK
jgi:hypothetical protein